MSPRTPPVLALKGVSLRDGPLLLFDGVDLALEPRARACLVGRNGAGKSTLLRILAGEAEGDEGERTLTPGARIVRVPQEPVVVGETLLDYAMSGGAPAYRAEAELEAFDVPPGRRAQGLSGGEARRAALAKAFAEEPDVLLLDEPTNHLDIITIETLEQRIRDCRAAILAVSHDRAFLMRITRACFWLEGRRVRRLDKGFSAFEGWAEGIMAEETESARRLDKAIERESAWFGRSITARRSRNEGRALALRRMREERAGLLRNQPQKMELATDAGSTAGRIVAELKHVSKSFGEKVVLKDFSTRILRGDRVAIVGPNGAGKTTLVRMLLGEAAPDSGTVRLGKGLEIAYLDQARATLQAGTTLWDALANSGSDQIMVRGRPRHVAGYAKEFLFRDSQLRQPVESLSGGERNRLLLARTLARPANVLVLDEPTNDLDMDTLDLLEDTLADYEGTLILVSHDRDFIERLATSTIALDGRGHAVETPGGWTDFESQNPGFFSPSPPPGGEGGARPRSGREGEGPLGTGGATPAAAAQRKLSFKDAHRLQQLDALMPKLQGEIAAHEKALDDPGLYARDPKAFDRTMKALDAARAALAAAEDEWLALEEKREALTAG
ncbi:MAG: ABC-F family ATP-binding cassette domain-containing protein [Caulobacteraceae bacterium]